MPVKRVADGRAKYGDNKGDDNNAGAPKPTIKTRAELPTVRDGKGFVCSRRHA